MKGGKKNFLKKIEDFLFKKLKAKKDLPLGYNPSVSLKNCIFSCAFDTTLNSRFVSLSCHNHVTFDKCLPRNSSIFSGNMKMKPRFFIYF